MYVVAVTLMSTHTLSLDARAGYLCDAVDPFCLKVPASTCNGNTAIIYEGKGSCNNHAVGESKRRGECTHASQR